MSLVNIKEINLQYLQNLIHNKVFENKELEYKSYLFPEGKLSDNKKKLIKEIAAFANTNGGIIVIGMEEDKNRIPVKLKGVGFTLNQFDNWLSSFRQSVLSGIKPHLHGVECIPVPISDDDIVIVIYVPRSFARPHSVWDGNKDEFFMRYANGISYMDIDDLRRGFLYANKLQDKIRQFHNSRISMILDNECVGNLGNYAKLVFYIVPEWGFEIGNRVDIKKVNDNSLLKLVRDTNHSYRYNADGYCVYSQGKNGIINTYTQLFHNGIIEVVEISMISNYKDKQTFDWVKLQQSIINALNSYESLLRKLDVPKPWYLFGTILNGKGYITSDYFGESAFPLDRNIINSLLGVCTDEIPFNQALKPVFDSLSNAFGFSQSFALSKEI